MLTFENVTDLGEWKFDSILVGQESSVVNFEIFMLLDVIVAELV